MKKYFESELSAIAAIKRQNAVLTIFADECPIVIAALKAVSGLCNSPLLETVANRIDTESQKERE